MVRDALLTRDGDDNDATTANGGTHASASAASTNAASVSGGGSRGDASHLDDEEATAVATAVELLSAHSLNSPPPPPMGRTRAMTAPSVMARSSLPEAARLPDGGLAWGGLPQPPQLPPPPPVSIPGSPGSRDGLPAPPSSPGSLGSPARDEAPTIHRRQTSCSVARQAHPSRSQPSRLTPTNLERTHPPLTFAGNGSRYSNLARSPSVLGEQHASSRHTVYEWGHTLRNRVRY